VNIRHERPMPDLAFRVQAPLKVTLEDGSRLEVTGWNLKGIYVEIGTPDLPSNALLSIPFQGIDIQFPVEFDVDPVKGELRYKGLTGRQRETLSVFYNSLLSGKMASTNDVITSLDTPVDLIEMGETEEEKTIGLAKTNPRKLRIIWNVFFYLILSYVIFGLVGVQVWKRIDNIYLDHGRFIAPMVEFVAPSTSYVKDIPIDPNSEVQKGDVIVEMSDPAKDTHLEDIRTKTRAAEREVKKAQNKLREHLALEQRNRKPYLDHYLKQMEIIRSGSADASFNRVALRDAWNELKTFDLLYPDPITMSPKKFASIEAKLKEDYDAKNETLTQFKRELGNIKIASASINIMADRDYIVRQLFVEKGNLVRFGTKVAVVEENKTRTAVAWLSDSMADQVYTGMPATLAFNIGREKKSISATITSINAGADPSQPDKYGMLIELTADRVDLEKSRRLFAPNAPVKVFLKRDLLAPVRRFLGFE